MQEITIRAFKKSGVSVEALYELFKDGYQQWSDNNIDSAFLHKTPEEFRKVIDRAKTFVAQDAETGELLGMHCFYTYREKYVFGFFLAILPSVKRQGIATRMLQKEVEILKRNGYRYIKSNTSTRAVWSVQWHLKNGYYIVGYSRNERNNNASYTFRKQLAADVRHHPTDLLWMRPIAPVTAKIRYCLSWLVACICKDKSGKLNVIGRIAKEVRSKMSEG